MSKLLGIPIVEISAKTGDGFEKLLNTVEKQAKKPIDSSEKISYSNDIKGHLAELQEIIKKDETLMNVPSIWTAVKLLERDTIIIDKVQKSEYGSKILIEVDKVSKHLHDVYQEGSEEVIANARYAFIDGLVAESVKKPAVEKETTTDKIDKIVTNRILAPFIFIIIMWAMFQLTFTIGAPFQDMIDVAFGSISEFVAGFIEIGRASCRERG